MFFEFIANVFFPPSCLACQRGLRSGLLCETCFCAIPLRTIPPAEDSSFSYRWGAAGSYSNTTLQVLIHQLKFQSRKDAAIPLGRLLVAYSSALSIDTIGYCIIPIPLSPRRRRARGFNQAELIAGFFAAAFGLHLETKSLARVKHAKPQSETKSAAERKENIRGAFGVIQPEFVRGKNIILIDDVMTSGTTFLEASLALKKAGANDILALAVAKTEQ
jgi:ComF family protein